MHFPAWFRCPDCNIAPGGRHHANCDQEECPKCGGQLLGCSCFDTEGEKGGMGT
jgi:Zn-finger nucleic acid-binding protein